MYVPTLHHKNYNVQDLMTKLLEVIEVIEDCKLYMSLYIMVFYVHLYRYQENSSEDAHTNRVCISR